jgi:hypothetical protein
MIKEKRNKIIRISIILGFIMISAFAVRFYKFHDWLYFKMDQARDAAMTSNSVIHGAEYLPLLGPRAGATKVPSGYLRLGPVFYYFQYLSGKIFHSTSPDVFAYPELFFSIAVIPLLYFFLRFYFSERTSLLITAMYAFSFIVIEYSRFSWNPNSLPFFAILTFYSLLKFLDAEKVKKKVLWVSLCGLGLSIGSQLHFFGFFSLVGIVGIVFLFHYEIWKKESIVAFFKKDNLKKFFLYFSLFTLFFLLFYIPVIVSDIFKNGENSKNFFYAIGSKPKDKPLMNKLITNATEQIRYFSLLLTSFYYSAKDLKKNLIFPISLTVFNLTTGIFLAIFYLRKKTEKIKKDFLILLISWFTVFVILSIPVAYQLRPRFFILVFSIPFVFLGLLFEFLEEKFKKYVSLGLIFLITASILFLNGYGTYVWFKEQKNAQVKSTTIKRTLILKNKDGVTLEQLQKTVDYMYQHKKTGAVIYYYVKPEHVSPIKYLFRQKQMNDPSLNFSPLKINDDPNAQYFGIVPYDSGTKSIENKFGQNYNIASEARFGQLKVYEINLPNRNISANFRFNRERGITDRIFWKDVFGIKGDPNAIIEGGE